jgi:hypothetical protein
MKNDREEVRSKFNEVRSGLSQSGLSCSWVGLTNTEIQVSACFVLYLLKND